MSSRPVQPRRLDLIVGRVLARLAALALIALTVAVGVNLWRDALSSDINASIASDHALTQAHTGMLDQETGLRGYISTGQALYLEPFRQGQTELSSGNAALQRGAEVDPSLVPDYLALRVGQDAWLNQWVPSALNPSAWSTPISRDALLANGKRLFDTYRVAQSRLAGDLVQRIAHSESLASAVSAGGLGIELSIGLLGVLVWLRSRRQLRRAVVGPVTTILANLERIEAGDFSAPAPPSSGPSEMLAIADRLVALTVALQVARDGMDAREHDSREHAARLRQIVEMGREIAGSLNLRYVLDAVAKGVIGIGLTTRCVVWLTDESSGVLVPVHESDGVKGRVAGLAPVVLGEQAVGKAARFGRIVGPEQVTHRAVSDGWTSALAIPMIVGARVVGVIEAATDDDLVVPTEVMELIDTLSSQAATAIEAARLYEHAERVGKTDSLTLLPNRRELETVLSAEVARAQRYRRPLALAMIDLDHFKSVNDELGHTVGDQVLQETAAVMRAVLREVDLIFRYGGEEFLVLMPETTGEVAFGLCDRLRREVTDRVTVPGNRRLTVSCGVAGYPDDAGDGRELIRVADSALYDAKRLGRDRVSRAGSAPSAERVPQPA